MRRAIERLGDALADGILLVAGSVWSYLESVLSDSVESLDA